MGDRMRFTLQSGSFFPGRITSFQSTLGVPEKNCEMNVFSSPANGKKFLVFTTEFEPFGFPQLQPNPELNKIQAIAGLVINTLTGITRSFCLVHGHMVIDLKLTQQYNVEKCADERALIIKFIELLESEHANVVAGCWHTDLSLLDKRVNHVCGHAVAIDLCRQLRHIDMDDTMISLSVMVPMKLQTFAQLQCNFTPSETSEKDTSEPHHLIRSICEEARMGMAVMHTLFNVPQRFSAATAAVV